ncbi:hypothetical protein KL918_002812 [Ogataea parapolymorpha]|nr:hypothetical protein KL918_002812 [Ogataea parapolymorpha]KAG7871759.1 hypothetical protein KL916_003609 [Ogataea parapolymorpha]
MSPSYKIVNQVFVIVLDDPHTRNALTIPQFVQLAELLELADKHPHTTATLVVGRGPMFSAGANIKTVAELKNKTSSEILSEISAKNLPRVRSEPEGVYVVPLHQHRSHHGVRSSGVAAAPAWTEHSSGTRAAGKTTIGSQVA